MTQTDYENLLEERDNLAKKALRYTGYTAASCLVGAAAAVTDSGVMANILGATIGTVSVIGNEKGNIGIADIFSSSGKAAETSRYFCITGDDSITFELIGNEKTLKPGESLVVSHTYRIITDLKNQIGTILEDKK